MSGVLAEVREDVVTRALRRNDRFLIDIVEAFSLCPFARGTRTTDKLAREVIEEPLDPPALTAYVRKYDDAAADIILLILPTYAGAPKAFERYLDELRRADEAVRPPLFAMAPFHPQTVYHTDTPQRMVGLFRRSPDPTIQLVRFTAIDSAKRRAPDGKFFFDGTEASWAAIAARPIRGLSEQITLDNFTRLRARADELAAKLASI